uniref:TIR domain-containing protein n=1 Tax=Panagrolaimus sp. JU765 TaxID=591449 RepID=A0AC34R5G5_9BILA
MFEGFRFLKDLRIANCHGPDLPTNTFRGLPKLKSLHLSKLTKKTQPGLAHGLFQPIAALEKLTLAESAIRELSDGLFCPLSKLQILNLTANRLSSARINTDENKCQLPQLIIFDVSANLIESIEANDLTAFPDLRQLSAKDNELLEMDQNAFKFVPTLQHLDLENNQLSELVPFPDGLLHLNLARNRLTMIPVAVANLDKLISLNLSANSIDMNTPFSLLSTSLETVDLSHNKFDAVPLKVVQQSLSSILYLHLDGNQIAVLQPRQFQNLTRLQKLDLSDNQIKLLNEDCFIGLAELVELSVRNNSIYHLDVGVFADVGRKLQKLDFSSNMLRQLPMAVEKLAKIRSMDFSKNQIEKLQIYLLEKMVHLSRLDLSDNKISLIESYVFYNCPHLTDLNLSNNRIDSLAKDAFENCPRLHSLDLSQNKISGFSRSIVELKTLRFLNASKNNLEILEWSEFPDEILNLDLSWNKISTIGAATESRVKKINLKSNKLTRVLQGQLSRQIEQIDLSSNLVEFIEEGALIPLTNLKVINLKDNQLKSIQKAAFREPDSSLLNGLLTTHVYLAGNPLDCECKTGWTIQPLAFNTLPALKKLDLSKNFLTELRGDELFKSARIEKLNLEDNRLFEMDSRLLEQLPNLQVLELSKNAFDELPELLAKNSKISRVSLAGNPFRCDCDWQRFQVQKWLMANMAKVPDFESVECVENVTSSFLTNDSTVLTALVPNRGEHLFAMPMREFLFQANESICAIEAGGIFGGGPAMNLLLVVACAIFAFAAICGSILVVLAFLRRNSGGKNRYVKAPPSLNCSTTTPGSSPLPLPLIQYDAFVSYSKHDEEMVINKLYQRLEKEEDYSLCLLHREGARLAYHAAVHNVSDELIHQMDACNALIIVLTKNFLENEWEMVQIKTAHRLFAKNRNKRIITILSDEIRPNELDAELGKILRNNTRIRESDQLFWNLLMNAMPLKINSQHSSSSTVLGDGSDIYSEMYGSVVPSEVV